MFATLRSLDFFFIKFTAISPMVKSEANSSRIPIVLNIATVCLASLDICSVIDRVLPAIVPLQARIVELDGQYTVYVMLYELNSRNDVRVNAVIPKPMLPSARIHSRATNTVRFAVSAASLCIALNWTGQISH
jgi:hypothetical protein